MTNVTRERMALTSLGIGASHFSSRASGLPAPTKSIVAHRDGRCFVRTLRLAAQWSLQIPRIIAIEEMAEEPAVQIGGAKQPIGDRKREVHVTFHHQPRIVMRGVMAAQRVYKRAMAYK